MSNETAGETKPFILWQNYGSEGWQPEYFMTIHEALAAPRYQSDWLITKRVNWTVAEVAEPQEEDDPGDEYAVVDDGRGGFFLPNKGVYIG